MHKTTPLDVLLSGLFEVFNTTYNGSNMIVTKQFATHEDNKENSTTEVKIHTKQIILYANGYHATLEKPQPTKENIKEDLRYIFKPDKEARMIDPLTQNVTAWIEEFYYDDPEIMALPDDGKDLTYTDKDGKKHQPHFRILIKRKL